MRRDCCAGCCEGWAADKFIEVFNDLSKLYGLDCTDFRADALRGKRTNLTESLPSNAWARTESFSGKLANPSQTGLGHEPGSCSGSPRRGLIEEYAPHETAAYHAACRRHV
jgi:hypothetical protein